MALALCLTLLPTAALADTGAGESSGSETHDHYLCAGKDETGKDKCTEVGHSETDTVTFTAWTDEAAAIQWGEDSGKTAANSLPKSLPLSEYYYLTTDVTLDDTWVPPIGLTLCLNGHSITMKDNKSVISVSSRFTLVDCKGDSHDDKYGKITHASGYKGHGVELTGGTFNMYGGNITQNDAGNNGGGVYMMGSCNFNLYGGQITGNSTTYCGGGVYSDYQSSSKCTINMYDGEISGNNGTQGGGGVFIGSASTFAMSGGKISGNTDGGGTSSNGGGGVCVAGAMTVSGNVEITGNTKGSDSAASNVYLRGSDAVITIDGALTGKIGVTKKFTTKETVYVATGADEETNYTDIIVSDNDTYKVAHDSTGGTKLVLVENTPAPAEEHKHCICGKTTCNQPGSHPSDDKLTDFIPWTDALAKTQNGNGKTSSNSLPRKEGNYYLTGDVTLTETWTPADGTVLCLNGYNITMNGDEDVIKVGRNVTFTLCDCKGGTNEGGQITHGTKNETNSKYIGRGVYVTGGTLNMYGGSITDNTTNSYSYDYGAGVYMNGGAFNMYGGEITRNTAKNGGGVNVAVGTFNMYGGEINGNTATNNGGGVFANGTFTMTGGSITRNTAKSNGGGVYVNRGYKFEMTGGSISGNTATGSINYGGGVFVDSDGTFTMGGSASITGNTASWGGGVCVYGKFNMTGGTIGGTQNGGPNEAKYGGGVWVRGTFTMSGNASIIKNEATDGGGVYVSRGTFTMSGNASIIKNEATSGNGGGVYVSGSTFTMTGGSITRNTAKSNGGGVWVEGIAFTVSGSATVTGNTANNVYLKEYCIITIAKEELADDASIGVTTEDSAENRVIASGEGLSDEIANKFKSDDTQYEVKCDATKKQLTLALRGDPGPTPPVPVTQITLDTNAATLKVGDTKTLTATIQPDNATNREVIWESSAPEIATVADGTVTAVKAGSATIIVKATNDSNVSASCVVSVTSNTPVEPEKPEPKPEPSQPGGSTSGGSSGGSSSGSYDSNPIVKTETRTNPDGSVTKTETKKDGTVIETTTEKDGSVTKTETRKDGSSVTENKAADGSAGTVKTDKNGRTEAKTALSGKAIEDAKKSGEAVKAPVEVEATRNSNTAPTVKVELPKNAGETEVEIPVSNAKPGTVAVLVHADGTEEILKDSIPTEGGIRLTVDGSTTVKIIDNSKDFIDIRNHWAEDEIDFVSARELVNGVSDTIYAPNASATRAQLWTILARQNDANLNGGNTWYEKAQNWAKDKGVSDGANPNGTISRAQMVTMLWRAVGRPAAGSTVNFIDVPADAYYASAVAWAVENGITTGIGGGRFDPNGACTRAQIAAFLARSMK